MTELEIVAWWWGFWTALLVAYSPTIIFVAYILIFLDGLDNDSDPKVSVIPKKIG